MKPRRAVAVVLALFLLVGPALAHVPGFPEGNTTPERAVEVPDATKSWSFYDTLGPGEATYYRVSLAPGERLFVGTFTPRSGGFTPSLVVMSPSIDGTDGVPAGVTVPDGMGAVVVEGERPDGASYEPFAPSANYHTASIDRPVETETTYLVAVYEPADRSGPAGVTVGYREAFSAEEYVTVPLDVVRTHLWEGQHPLVAVGPFVLAVLLGAAVALRRRPDLASSPLRLALGGAGLVVAASGVNTAVQMALALSKTGPTLGALVTAAFVVVPLLCGGWALRLAGREDLTVGARTRAGLGAAGIVALLFWGGYVAGPLVLFAVAAAPGSLLGQEGRGPSNSTDTRE